MLIVTISAVLIYEFTIGKQIDQFTNKIDSLSSKIKRMIQWFLLHHILYMIMKRMSLPKMVERSI